jgi:phage gpG-like protein
VPILKFDFHMLGDMASWQTDGNDAVLVGTNAPYGAIHQFGGTIQRAARPANIHLKTVRAAAGSSKPVAERALQALGHDAFVHEHHRCSSVAWCQSRG